MNIRTFAILSVLVHSPTHGAEDANLAQCVEMNATEIKKLVDPEQWSVSSGPTSIVVESKFELRMQRRVSPAFGAEVPTSKYRMELQFKPELSRDDFLKLAEARMQKALIARYGATTKVEWGESQKFLHDHPLPRYRAIDRVGKSYSVYLTSNDSSSLTLLPTEKYAEAKGTEAKIDQVLWPLEN